MWTVLILSLWSSALADYNSDWMRFSSTNSLSVPADFANSVERYQMGRSCAGGQFKLTLSGADGTTSAIIDIGAKDADGNSLGVLTCPVAGGDDIVYNFQFVLSDKGCMSAFDYDFSLMRVLKTEKHFGLMSHGHVVYKMGFDESSLCATSTKKVQAEALEEGQFALQIMDKSMSGENPDWYIVKKGQAVSSGDPNFGDIEKYGLLVPCDGAHFKLSLTGEGSDEVTSYLEVFDQTKGTFVCKNGQSTEFKLKVSANCNNGVLTYRLFKTADDVKMTHAGLKEFYKKTDGDCYRKTVHVQLDVYDEDKAVYFSVGEQNNPGYFFDVFKFSKAIKVNDPVVLGEPEVFHVIAPCRDTKFKIMMYSKTGTLNAHVHIANMNQGQLRCVGGGVINFDFQVPAKCFVDQVVYEITKSKTNITLKNMGNLLFTKTFSETDGKCRAKTERIKTNVMMVDDVLYLEVA